MKNSGSAGGMNWELKRIRILHAGLFGAVMGGLLGGVVLVFGMLGMLLGGGSGVAGGVFGLLIMAVGSVLMGGTQGFMGAALYNLVARMTGGYKIQLQPSV